MYSHTKAIYRNSGSADMYCCNIPIECIRKTRSLNVDSRLRNLSCEMYRILKSNNGRRLSRSHYRYSHV